jgi:organic hydroperoxide reductase OsmC/OhrA
MLWFLAIAAKKGFVVESYTDNAVGVLEKNSEGRPAVTRVTLRPKVAFAGEPRPNADEFAQMHHKAHDECFIANSVKTDVRCEPAIT